MTEGSLLGHPWSVWTLWLLCEHANFTLGPTAGRDTSEQHPHLPEYALMHPLSSPTSLQLSAHAESARHTRAGQLSTGTCMTINGGTSRPVNRADLQASKHSCAVIHSGSPFLDQQSDKIGQITMRSCAAGGRVPGVAARRGPLGQALRNVLHAEGPVRHLRALAVGRHVQTLPRGTACDVH